MILREIPGTINGNNVVAFTNAKAVKSYFGETDLSSLARWYEDDPNKNHLGMINLFRGIENYPIPMYLGMIKNGATISVNGPNGKYRYDLVNTKSFNICVAEDASDQYKPGQDGGVFNLPLNHKYEPGDILTYDVRNGCQVIVSGEWEIKRASSEVFIHPVKLVSMDRFKYFPKDFLKPGVKYWKIGHGMGEYSTQYSSVSGQDRAGTITCEFELGNHRGVEGKYTMYAAEKRHSGATVDTQRYMEYVDRKMFNMQKQYNEKFDVAVLTQAVRTQDGPRLIRNRNMLIASFIEVQVLAELGRLEAYQLMFQKAGVVYDNNSIIRLNEGLYHQLKRGFTITYGRKNGITKAILQQAANYVFRNSDLPITKRYMKFRCGAHAFNNMTELFRQEIYSNLNLTDGKLLGSDRLINNPISGPNDALVMGPIMFKSVFLAGIGMVDIEHDSSLDYAQMTDRAALVDNKYAPSSWSMIMEDVTSREYSNAYTAIPDTSNAVIGNMNSNVFYVKPEGNSLFWGHERGRWSSYSPSDILASHKTMDESIWAHSMSACWVMDNSRMLLIELQPTDL